MGATAHANGEIATRAISMLAILTGNSVLTEATAARVKVHTAYRLSYADLGKPDPDQHFDVYVDRSIERGPEMTALRDGVRGKDKWMCRSK